MVVCRYFQSGKCARGSKCPFQHIFPRSAAGQMSGNISASSLNRSTESRPWSPDNKKNQSLAIVSMVPLAKKWLEQCLSEHGSCKKKAQLCTIWSSDNTLIVHDLGHNEMMPRRILSFPIEPPILSEEDYIRLVDLNDTTEQIPYLALSHRWGPNETCRTTKSSLSSLQENGINLTDLPRTFRDAIVLSRALGYSSLWIDSLCIVQDDKEDWKDEAPRMGVIYGNAVCTISAMDALDSDGGLLISEMKETERGGLDKRAWVCQERMIAPRSLHFSNNTVSWECRECELKQPQPSLPITPITAATNGHEETLLGPKQIFAVFRDFRVPGAKFDENQHEFIDMSLDLLGEQDDYTPFMVAWWQFVSLYSGRMLTFESDRFLAMNGVASLTQRWTQLRNSWGLWRHFLERDLLWYIDPKSTTSRRPKKWLGPSWSWVSTVEGRVINDYYSQLPILPTLMMKPQIGIPVGTSFDQSLPIPAWSGRQYHSITLHGDLRSGEIITSLDDKGNKCYEVKIESNARYSEAEEHEFRPDALSEFEVDKPVKVKCLLISRVDAKRWNLSKYRDMRLVLVQKGGDRDIQPVLEYLPEVDMFDERTMTRVGYLETSYEIMRDKNDIQNDSWWRYVRLI